MVEPVNSMGLGPLPPFTCCEMSPLIRGDAVWNTMMVDKAFCKSADVCFGKNIASREASKWSPGGVVVKSVADNQKGRIAVLTGNSDEKSPGIRKLEGFSPLSPVEDFSRIRGLGRVCLPLWSRFHNVTPGLIFLGYFMEGLHEALAGAGVKIRSAYISTSESQGQTIKATASFYPKAWDSSKPPPLVAFEEASVYKLRCDVLLGVVGSSAKIHIQGTANLLIGYPAGPIIDWINRQSWVESLVFKLLSTNFASPEKKVMEQVHMWTAMHP
ncbi:endogenous Bornavirus-like nucleoprotein 1 [Loxodonta africana]|uniref:endogenous Bornavirus-like nucleoprotein 1 n=1 Tax=Loxodonta africana TaxID=9785 RepID=UPI0030CE62CE